MKITVKAFVAEKRSAGKQQGVAQRHAEQARSTHGYLLFSGKTDLKDPVQEDLSSLSHLWNVPNDLVNVSTIRGWSFAVNCLHVYSLLSDDTHQRLSSSDFLSWSVIALSLITRTVAYTLSTSRKSSFG